jgi:hypothetical protein
MSLKLHVVAATLTSTSHIIHSDTSYILSCTLHSTHCCMSYVLSCTVLTAAYPTSCPAQYPLLHVLRPVLHSTHVLHPHPSHLLHGSCPVPLNLQSPVLLLVLYLPILYVLHVLHPILSNILYFFSFIIVTSTGLYIQYTILPSPVFSFLIFTLHLLLFTISCLTFLCAVH